MYGFSIYIYICYPLKVDSDLRTRSEIVRWRLLLRILNENILTRGHSIVTVSAASTVKTVAAHQNGQITHALQDLVLVSSYINYIILQTPLSLGDWGYDVSSHVLGKLFSIILLPLRMKGIIFNSVKWKVEFISFLLFHVTLVVFQYYISN